VNNDSTHLPKGQKQTYCSRSIEIHGGSLEGENLGKILWACKVLDQGGGDGDHGKRGPQSAKVGKEVGVDEAASLSIIERNNRIDKNLECNLGSK